MKDKISASLGFLGFLNAHYIASSHERIERIFSDKSVVLANLSESEKISDILEKIFYD